MLTEVEIKGKRDFLRGLKKSVIVDRLIPGEAGLVLQCDHTQRDEVFDAEECKALLQQEKVNIAAELPELEG